MKVSVKRHNKCRQVAFGGYTFEGVSSFLVLGSIINDDNSVSYPPLIQSDLHTAFRILKFYYTVKYFNHNQELHNIQFKYF